MAAAAVRLEFPEEYTLEQSKKKIKKKINRLSKKGLETVTEFIGSTTTEAMFYLYLLKKYKSPCFLIEATSGDFWEILGINLKVKEFYSVEESKFINEYLERLAVKLVNCIKNNVNIIIIPLGLTLYSSDNEESGGHANVLIYRKQFNHIEHFEPHGKTGSFGNEKLNSSINLFLRLFVEYVNVELFKHKTPEQMHDLKPVELIESSQVCPYFKGFQIVEEESAILKIVDVEPGGYCAAWSMFFTELCLKNPQMTSSQIITSIFSTAWFKMSTEDYFRHIIRGYATFINEKISTYFSFLFDKKINIADIEKMNRIKQIKLKDELKIIINIEMLLTLNPNALDDKMKLLQHKMFYRENLNLRDYFKTTTELSALEKYKQHMNDFNSPINTPSPFTPTPLSTPLPSPPTPTPTPPTVTTPVTTPLSLVTKPKTQKKSIICPPNKVLNPKTNRCIKIKPEKPVRQVLKAKKEALEQELRNITKECPPNKVLNPDTGRCIKVKTVTKKECPLNKMINPKTGRCVKIKIGTRKNNKK
jgi:hypothetical protein